MAAQWVSRRRLRRWAWVALLGMLGCDWGVDPTNPIDPATPEGQVTVQLTGTLAWGVRPDGEPDWPAVRGCFWPATAEAPADLWDHAACTGAAFQIAHPDPTFRVTLPVGAYTLAAAPAGYEPVVRSITVARPQRLPDQGLPQQAIAPLVLTRASQLVAITGVAQRRLGDDHSGIAIRTANAPYDTVTRDDGAFQLWVADGARYTLVASADGYESAELEVPAGAPDARLDLTPIPAQLQIRAEPPAGTDEARIAVFGSDTCASADGPLWERPVTREDPQQT